MMQRAKILALGITLAALTTSCVEPPYEGSSFDQVWNDVTSDPWAEMPHYEVSNDNFFDGLKNLMLAASKRTLADRSDLLPHFDKLLHPNGSCLAGTWSITEPNDYTGLFAEGTDALVIARASTALTETTNAGLRVFSMAGKVFPTTDPSEVVSTANWFLMEDLGGTQRDHWVDALQTNDILDITLSADFLAKWRTLLTVMLSFTGADGGSIPDALERQLYPLSEAGVPAADPVHTPRWIQITGSPDTLRVDEADFRDELRLENHADGLDFDIRVADVGTRLGEKEWQYIGRMHFTEEVISTGCDHRLHFAHPSHRDTEG